jgi:hypothetical protein
MGRIIVQQDFKANCESEPIVGEHQLKVYEEAPNSVYESSARFMFEQQGVTAANPSWHMPSMTHVQQSLG